ncbi:MAG: hypothetical protein LBP41_02310 [Holosporaceae bacterium]|jgi:hypothetical protein|nr:hypothetical protein [Holosporaceae bacterium]
MTNEKTTKNMQTTTGYIGKSCRLASLVIPYLALLPLCESQAMYGSGQGQRYSQSGRSQQDWESRNGQTGTQRASYGTRSGYENGRYGSSYDNRGSSDYANKRYEQPYDASSRYGDRPPPPRRRNGSYDKSSGEYGGRFGDRQYGSSYGSQNADYTTKRNGSYDKSNGYASGFRQSGSYYPSQQHGTRSSSSLPAVTKDTKYLNYNELGFGSSR